MPGWTSVDTLNPVLPASFLRGRARNAGVPVGNDHGDTLHASRSFLTLAADRAGPRRIRLPEPADVHDPLTGRCLRRRVTEFEHEFQAKETVIWPIDRR